MRLTHLMLLIVLACTSAVISTASGKCKLPWSGPPDCDVLVRLPVNRSWGFHAPSATGRVSSWGGSVLRDVDGDGLYHMFAAEMVGDCGIDHWEPNSQIVHAVAERPEGPYVKHDVVLPPFAHEPNAVRGPKGEWVIYATVRNPNGYPTVNCSSKAKVQPPFSSGSGGPMTRSTYMLYSQTGPYGPWSDPVLVLKPNMSSWGGQPALIDTNLAVAIFPDGSLVGIWRLCENTDEFDGQCVSDCCTFPHRLSARNWKDPATYHPDSEKRMFPDVKPYGSEDPMLWIDHTTGQVHAILHDEQGPARCTAIGRHAISKDNGTTWTYAKSDAYNGTVSFYTDGGSTEVVELYRRERPHMIVDGLGRPTHLTNGVQESTASDRSYTLVQPLQLPEELPVVV